MSASLKPLSLIFVIAHFWIICDLISPSLFAKLQFLDNCCKRAWNWSNVSPPSGSCCVCRNTKIFCVAPAPGGKIRSQFLSRNSVCVRVQDTNRLAQFEYSFTCVVQQHSLYASVIGDAFRHNKVIKSAHPALPASTTIVQRLRDMIVHFVIKAPKLAHL